MNIALQKLSKIYEKESTVEGDVLHFSDMGVDIHPTINKLKNASPGYQAEVVLHFKITCPQWGQYMFEVSAAVGATEEEAMDLALFSFTAGFMRGLKWMMRGCSKDVHCDCQCAPEPLTSHYNGSERKWEAFISEGVYLGYQPTADTNWSAFSFWDTVRDGVAKRLGNQKVVLVKLYGAKVKGRDAIGECRIDDIRIPELSKQLEEMVEKWEPSEASIRSYKQFAFLKQDASTLQPYPHTEDQIHSHTLMALRMFPKFDNSPDWKKAVSEAIGDDDLAAEICSFAPELCAKRRFANIEYDEKVTLTAGGKWTETLYLSQLPSYHVVDAALSAAISSGDVTEDMFYDLISLSAVWSVIKKAKDEGTDLTKAHVFTSSAFAMGNGYHLR